MLIIFLGDGFLEGTSNWDKRLVGLKSGYLATVDSYWDFYPGHMPPLLIQVLVKFLMLDLSIFDSSNLSAMPLLCFMPEYVSFDSLKVVPKLEDYFFLSMYLFWAFFATWY